MPGEMPAAEMQTQRREKAIGRFFLNWPYSIFLRFALSLPTRAVGRSHESTGRPPT